MTKVDIISGFLGAGKTTLIKKLIKETLHKENVILIENEFGEIGIDGGFLKEAGIEIKEMNSGCICCSLVGDFEQSLKKVMEEYAPERIIIEPSGVGKLSDVLHAVEGVATTCDLFVNSVTTVADAQKCKMYMKNFGEFFNDQIEHSKTIVLSRTQNISNEKVEMVLHELRHHNEHAAIITTPWDDVSGDVILEAMEQPNALEKELREDLDVCPHCGHHDDVAKHHHEHEHKEECCGGEHHHHDEACCHEAHHEHHPHHDHGEECTCGCHHDHQHHADEVFTSWGCETTHKYTKESLDTILNQLSDEVQFGTVLRAKGMLESVIGEWLYFDLVPEEYEIRTGSPTYTGRLCVIGASLKTDAIEALFQVK